MHAAAAASASVQPSLNFVTIRFPRQSKVMGQATRNAHRRPSRTAARVVGVKWGRVGRKKFRGWKSFKSAYIHCLHLPAYLLGTFHNPLRIKPLDGSGGRDRTYDLVINSHPLCR